MEKKYLEPGKLIYCTDCHIYFDADASDWRIAGISKDKDCYFAGLKVKFDENGKAYTE